MKRAILPVFFVLLAASLSFADPPSALTKMSLQAGHNPEGIAVNPVTHKAYVVAEETGTGLKAVMVFDSAVLNARSAPKKLGLPIGSTARAPKVVPIPNESEYIAIDPVRNLVYVSTKFGLRDAEETEDTEPPEIGDEGTEPADPPETEVLTMGTLTVIDGNTDTVIGTVFFNLGTEPEGVAVDTVNGVVYVGAKAPEGEASSDDVCSSGTPIPDIGEPGDVECWTAGHIYAFFVDPVQKSITYLKDIPAGDDPESVAFVNGMIYAANEDDGTVTIATAVMPDGSGGVLVTDLPKPLVPYSLHVFNGPNPLACLENQFEADKMAAGGGSVFVTDDRSRVAKITEAAVVGTVDIPGATVCEAIPNTDGGGANTANNIAFMQRGDRGFLYVVSEQNTVTVLDPLDLTTIATITVPDAVHLDAIGVDGAMNRVWITDEDLHAVFVLRGACTNGTGGCDK